MPIRPSDAEEQYFNRETVQRLKDARVKVLENTVQQDKDRLKERHWMRCPKCGMELAEVEFRNVLVDACFACGGMFLDKGEIEKVVAWEEPSALQKMAQSLFGLRKT